MVTTSPPSLGMAPFGIAAPPNSRPVAWPRAAMVYLRSIGVDFAHRMLKRRRRTDQQVQNDYDHGEWAQHAEARRWEGAANLEAFLDRTAETAPMTCMIQGRLFSVAVTEYYRLRRRAISAIIDGLAPAGQDTVCEVGSGSGTNLLSLALEPRWRKIFGYELSPTGREVTATVASHFGVADRVRVGAIDLLDAASPGFAELEGSYCFSHYCLEQLPHRTEEVLRNLHRAGVQRMVHLEPTFELLDPLSLRDHASRSYVLRQDYQRTIVSAARTLEREGLIRIVAVERLYHAPRWRNPPTLVVWDRA